MSVPKSTKTTTGHYQALMKFDSHGYVKRMTGGGFNEEQAETLAAEQADLLGNLATRQDMEGMGDELEEVKQNMATKDMLAEIKQNMVTKGELKALDAIMQKEFVLVRQEMETQRATLVAALTQNKFDMIKWMTGYFLSGLALMAALVKLT